MASPSRAATAQALSPDPAATRSQPPGRAAGREPRSRRRAGGGAAPATSPTACSAGKRQPVPQGRSQRHRPNLGGGSPIAARRRMGGSPDAARPMRTPSVTASARTTQEADHDHPAHRDAHHRRRPGRARDGLPPAAPGPALPGRRPQRADRRQLASAVGHPQALQPRQVRRASGPGVPGAAVVLPRQGGRRRLPGEVRHPRRPAGPDVDLGRPARGPAGRRVHRRASAPTRSPATTSWSPPAASGARRTCRRSRPTSTPAIRQLHSSEYRRPAQLADGPVLVVGASHSGCDIAYEVAEHLPTTLVGPDRGQIPLQWNSRAIRLVFPSSTSCGSTS